MNCQSRHHQQPHETHFSTDRLTASLTHGRLRRFPLTILSASARRTLFLLIIVASSLVALADPAGSLQSQLTGVNQKIDELGKQIKNTQSNLAVIAVKLVQAKPGNFQNDLLNEQKQQQKHLSDLQNQLNDEAREKEKILKEISDLKR